jgi:hypothetical protein
LLVGFSVSFSLGESVVSIGSCVGVIVGGGLLGVLVVSTGGMIGEFEGTGVSGVVGGMVGEFVGAGVSGVVGGMVGEFVGAGVSGVVGGMVGEFVGTGVSGVVGGMVGEFVGTGVSGVVGGMVGEYVGPGVGLLDGKLVDSSSFGISDAVKSGADVLIVWDDGGCVRIGGLVGDKVGGSKVPNGVSAKTGVGDTASRLTVEGGSISPLPSSRTLEGLSVAVSCAIGVEVGHRSSIVVEFSLKSEGAGGPTGGLMSPMTGEPMSL